MAISERPDTTEGFTPSPLDGQRMTLEEFLALPEENPPLEYLDGVVRQKVAAKPVHGSIQQFLLVAIELYARPRRLGVVLPGTRFVASGWSPVPDVVFYRRQSLRVRRAPADFTDPPDLAIEIMSPGQTLTKQIQKCLDLVARGTTVTLLVHQGEGTVFVFRQGQPLQVLQGDDQVNLEDVLLGFDLRVRHLFESENWAWLDDEPEIDVVSTTEAPIAGREGQAEDEAAAPERSEG